MNPTTAFLTDIGLVAFLSLSLVWYVKKHLNALLIALCVTAERTSFWLAFSKVTLVLLPLIFALDYKPELLPTTISSLRWPRNLSMPSLGS